MAWTMLLLAACLEVGWAIGLKYTHGFTRLWPSIWTLLAMGLSMVLLALSTRTLPIGDPCTLCGPASAPRARLCLGCICLARRRAQSG